MRYYCPACGTVVALERAGRLADRSVTPYPHEGWDYVPPDEPFEDGAADGVVMTCGEDRGRASWDGAGCGDRVYLSFVRYEDGEAVEPVPDSEHVSLGG